MGWSAKVHLKLGSMGSGNDDDGEGKSGESERQRPSDRCYSLHVSTCRLAAPTPSDVRAMERVSKASRLVDTLHLAGKTDNAVLGGDMSWDDDIDGPFPIEGLVGWVDAWSALRGDGGDGWTYDAVENPMLSEYCRKPEIRKRPDRFVCKLRDFRLRSIEMVGVEPIPGVTHCDDGGYFLPVLPSHHFGLLLTIVPKSFYE
uniref:Uncharacterized protein n=1 Tax=Leersia perrieri TaxID=77586 RepID=A0A0D9WZC3_9ORYZ